MKFEKWKDYIFISVLLIIAGILIILVNQFVIHDFPSTSDGYSYVLQAAIFSQGKLSTPVLNESNYFAHIIFDNEKIYSKYPFGWPLFLSLGILAGYPMIINLLFALGTILLTYLLTRKIFSEDIARLSAILLTFNVYFLSFSSSYFSHTCCLFFITLFFYIFFSYFDRKKTYLFLGLIFGMIFNIRPIDSFALGISFLLIYPLVLNLKIREFFSFDKKFMDINKKVSYHIILFLIGFGIFLGLFFLYNYFQTGDPLLMPFSKYDSGDKLNFFKPPREFLDRLLWNFHLLNWSFPFLMIFSLASIFIMKKYDSRFILSFCIFFFVLSIIYSFYFSSGDTGQFSPRYLYSSLFSLCILASYSFIFLKEKNKNIFKIVFVIFIIFLILSSYIKLIDVFNEEEGLIRETFNEKLLETVPNNSMVFSTGGCEIRLLLNAKDFAEQIRRKDKKIIYLFENYNPDKIKILKSDPLYSNRSFYVFNCSRSEDSLKTSFDKDLIKKHCSFDKINETINNTGL